MTEPLLDALDEIGRARDLVRLIAMTTRSNPDDEQLEKEATT